MNHFKATQVLFSPTTDCNLTCSHCTVDKSKRRLSKEAAKRFLTKCGKAGIERVGFTGGEPFLALDFLCALTREARRQGIFFDRIMTNAVWYKSGFQLRKSLEKLYKAGYDGSIAVSVDAFHRQDTRKVARFIKAVSRIWNRPDMVEIVYVAGSQDRQTRSKLARLAKLLGPGLITKKIRIELSPVGHAGRLKNGWAGNWFKEDFCRGPGNVFYVAPDGSVKPCCGYASDNEALTIGNIKRHSPSGIYRNTEMNRFASTIFNSGLSKIRKRLEKAGVSFPGKTGNHCFFCDYILSNVPKRILDICLD